MKLRPLALAGAVAGIATLRSRGRTTTPYDGPLPTDHEEARRILWHTSTIDFPWDFEQALSLALFRTFAVPEISVVLAGTGEFERRGQKRFDDTELVMMEMVKHGLDSGRGRQTIRRLNAMHGAFGLDNEDMVYVLSTFILEPLRWNEQYGWRRATEAECEAGRVWFTRLGEMMGLRDLPTSLEAWDRMNREYEAARFTYHPDNRAVADATLTMFLSQLLPAPLHPFGRLVVLALLDEPQLLAAFGYDPAPRALVRGVDTALRLRALVQRHLLPARRTPHDLTEVDRPTYPDGHTIDELGTRPTADDRARVDAHRATLATPADVAN